MPEQLLELDPRWKSYIIPTLSGGMRTSVPDYLLEDNECALMENVAVREGRVLVDTGYTKLGPTVRGTPKGLFVHESAAGLTVLLLVTDSTVYRYISALDKWHYVSDGVDTLLTANELVGSVDINVADTAGFAIGQFVGVELDNGEQHQTTVANVTAGAPGIVHLTAGIPSAASINNQLVKAVDLTGNDDDQVVFTPVPFHEWTVFTNGSNPPRRYDGNTCEVVPNLPSGGNLICKTLAVYRDAYLVLANLVESGVKRPYKMIWCSAGQADTWTGGDAGDNSLVDSRDPLVALRALGPYMIVYRRESIVRMEFQGLPTRTFNFRPINFGETVGSQGVGCLSPNSVFAFLNFHVVASAERIYIYDGGMSVTNISDRIFFGTFDSSGDVSREVAHRSFFFYIEQLDELYFCYPESGTSNVFCTRAVVVSLNKQNVMRKRKFNHEMTAAGVRLLGAGESVRIIDLQGTIAQQTWRIGGSGLGTGAPSILLCGNAPDQVYNYDLQSPTEDGLAISWVIETKHFRLFDRFMRVDALIIFASGSSFHLARYNTFDGLWTGMPPISLGGIMQEHRLHVQFVTEGLKLRLYGSAGGAEIGPIVARYREESLWRL